MNIPGAEFAPIIAVIGGRYQQPSELIAEHFRSVEAILHGVNLKTMSGHVRRLSCSDPDDMRAIWRRAALALGATEGEAATSTVRHLGGALLELYTTNDLGECVLRRWTGTMDRLPEATAALCLHIWGPGTVQGIADGASR